MNIVFLDFDGVINTPTGYDVNGSFRDNFNSVRDGRVNNYNAVKLVNRLCLENDLSIVVTSKSGWRYSFRKDDKGNYTINNYKRILYDSGIDEHAFIYSHTPATDFSKDMEIKIFLEKHKDIDKFIILDDSREEFSYELSQFLVLCDTNRGFTEREYKKAVELMHNQPNIKRGNSYKDR